MHLPEVTLMDNQVVCDLRKTDERTPTACDFRGRNRTNRINEEKKGLEHYREFDTMAKGVSEVRLLVKEIMCVV
jgi:hypothetical protein